MMYLNLVSMSVYSIIRTIPLAPRDLKYRPRRKFSTNRIADLLLG